MIVYWIRLCKRPGVFSIVIMYCDVLCLIHCTSAVTGKIQLEISFNQSNRTETEPRYSFYNRWKEYEMIQAALLHFTLEETQWEEDWSSLLSLASQPGSSLEQLHIFALAHILRRPIIVYGVKYVKSFRGEDIGYARFEGLNFQFRVSFVLFAKASIFHSTHRSVFTAVMGTNFLYKITDSPRLHTRSF